MPDVEEKQYIVIVDNDAIFSKALERFIKEKRENYEVVIVNEAENILTTISDIKPELVIMDLNFPKLGPVELYRSILECNESEKTHVMVFTRRKELEEVFETMNVASFVVKEAPFNLTYFLNEVDRIIERRPKPVLFIIDLKKKAHVKIVTEKAKRTGYRVIIAEGFGAFMSMAMENRPNYILMEYEQTDVITGAALIKRLKDVINQFSKSLWHTEKKIFILVYTETEVNYKEASMNAGADQYVGKIKDADQIMEKMNEIRREQDKILADEAIKAKLKLDGPAKKGPSRSDFGSIGF